MGYVLIHGRAPHRLEGKLDADLRGYIAEIAYGTPERIFGVLLDSGNFVALCEYEGGSNGAASYTFQRIPSFNYGAQFLGDTLAAFREFGTWIAHYSGSLKEKPLRSNILTGLERERINRTLRDRGYECVERLSDSDAERLLART